jgi:hypothetical protein
VIITPRAPESRDQRSAGRTTPLGLTDILRNVTHGCVQYSVLVFGLLMAAAPGDASAQVAFTMPTTCTPETVETRLIEWDLDPMEDFVPGAVVVDDQSSSRHSKVWFVTRNGETRLYRLTPGLGIKKDAAEAKSWPLGAIQTGGVRLRHSSDGRFVFVNTNDDDSASGALVAVDTKDNTRVTWQDRPQQLHMSDVSVDTRGGHTVFTAALAYRDQTGTQTDGVDGVVQSLRPGTPQYKNGQWIVPAEVTRWIVGGGAGTCDDTGAGSPCIPGVVVDRRRGHPIYFSAPQFVNKDSSIGAVGEIDPRPVKCNPSDPYSDCAKVRYWPIPAGTASPRQILLDDSGKVWGITSSGHLFSLEVDRNYDRGEVTRHDPIGPAPEDLFAVAPDGGTIGFTDADNNEVSVLFPEKVRQKVTPAIKLVKVVKRTLEGVREAAHPKAHVVEPRQATALGVKYTNPGDGTYLETDTSTGMASSGSEVSSFNPTGMAPDGARKTGSFFYGVTFSGGSNRIGHFEVKVDPDRELDHRKDDDDFDDDGKDNKDDADDDDDGRFDPEDDDDDNDCIVDTMDNDKDNDGVENDHDSDGYREHKRTDRRSMAPGESKDYEMAADANSLLILAVVEAATLTTPLSIEIVDPNGVVVLSTPPALGKAVASATPALAGVYTVRVKNGGTTSTTFKTTLIGKQIWF